MAGPTKIACLLSCISVLSSIDTMPAIARQHGTLRDPRAIRAVVIHTIGGPSCIGSKVRFRPIPVREDDADFWGRILRAAPVADAHFVIGRSGRISEVIPLSEIANHAIGVNQISIGIELVHRGDGLEKFEDAQIAKLIDTIKDVRQRFPAIELSNIVAHSDVDQQTCLCAGQSYRRRQDPGPNFPMSTVKDAVRLPTDPMTSTIALPVLTGRSSAQYCPIF